MQKQTKVIFTALLAFVFLTPAWAKKQQAAQMPPVVVSTITAQQGTYQEQTTSTGSLAALQGIALKPESSGRITAIHFKSGQYVTKDTPLVQIYPNILQAQLEQAQANLKLSELTYARDAKLFKEHAVSQAALDTAAANLKSYRGKVQEIQAQLDQNLIKAPFSGKLGLRQISLGDYISPSDTIVNLEALDPIRIDFSVPEVYLSKLKIGQQVTVQSDAYPKTNFTGHVNSLESLVSQNTRSIDIRATLSNKDHKLLPGMYVEVTMPLGPKETVVKIPQTALASDTHGYFVYKVEKQQAVRASVSIGHRDADNVVITKGLKAEDTIVSTGTNKVYPGAHLVIGK